MNVDPGNHVVKLCAQGIEAEMKGNTSLALGLYQKAWTIRTNDYESCIAAHYMARLQADPVNMLKWNMEALHFADKVTDGSVTLFYPSLYLNVAKSMEDTGNFSEAGKYYRLGAAQLDILPADRLGDITRDAIKRGLDRIGAQTAR